MKLSIAAAALFATLSSTHSSVNGQEFFCCISFEDTPCDPCNPGCREVFSGWECNDREDTCVGDDVCNADGVTVANNDPTGTHCCDRYAGTQITLEQSCRISIAPHAWCGPVQPSPDNFCCNAFGSDVDCDPCDFACRERFPLGTGCLSKGDMCSFIGQFGTCGEGGNTCCEQGRITGTPQGVCTGDTVQGIICGDRRGGGGGNDPHFKTWAGHFFDYHGECDLVLLSDPQFHNGLGLVIHIRTKTRYDYSFIESAAIQIGDDILEVSSFGQNMINGISAALSDNHEGYRMADKFLLTHQQKNAKEHVFTIDISGTTTTSSSGEERLVVSTFKDWVSVKLANCTAADFGNSIGLMGRFNDGATVGRDGTSVRDVALEDDSRNAYGQEWQVLDTEPQLFQTVRTPQYPQKCILPEKKSVGRRRRLGEISVSESEAAEACAQWRDEKHQKMCINDVMASGDLEVASVNPLF